MGCSEALCRLWYVTFLIPTERCPADPSGRNSIRKHPTSPWQRVRQAEMVDKWRGLHLLLLLHEAAAATGLRAGTKSGPDMCRGRWKWSSQFVSQGSRLDPRPLLTRQTYHLSHRTHQGIAYHAALAFSAQLCRSDSNPLHHT
jgi:hypothetical protein